MTDRLSVSVPNISYATDSTSYTVEVLLAYALRGRVLCYSGHAPIQYDHPSLRTCKEYMHLNWLRKARSSIAARRCLQSRL